MITKNPEAVGIDLREELDAREYLSNSIAGPQSPKI